MSDDLERQLQAFGRTMESQVGEPIRGTVGATSGSALTSRRRWAMLGAAACVVAVIAGLLALNRDDPPAVSDAPAGSDAAGSSADGLGGSEASAREPVPPIDALGVIDLGWALQSRSLTFFHAAIDVMSCDERLDLAVLGGLPVVAESYTRPDDDLVWLNVTYVDYGNADVADRRLQPARDPVESCEAWQQPADNIEPALIATTPENSAVGWRRGDLAEYVIADDRGLAVVVQGAYLTDDHWSGVVDGAAAYLASEPDRGPVVGGREAAAPPAPSLPVSAEPVAAPETAAPGVTLPTLADDLAESVGTNPLLLPTSDWSFLQRFVETLDVPQDLGCPADEMLAPFTNVQTVHDIFVHESLGLDMDVSVMDVPDGSDATLLTQGIAALVDCPGMVDSAGGGSLSVPTPTPNVPDASGFIIGEAFSLVGVPGPGNRVVLLEFEDENVTVDLVDSVVEFAQRYLFGEDSVPLGAGDLQVLRGDGAAQTPRDVGSTEQALTLWVSNQSFDEDLVDVTVSIDGRQVVDESFAVAGQHNWVGFVITGLEAGTHEIVATSGTGAVHTFSLTVEPARPRWAVIDYWYHPDDGEGRRFTFSESAEPIYFA